jgi:hypothetical protein
MKKESLIGKFYLPSDNNYVIDLSKGKQYSEFTFFDSKLCKIISEPFNCKRNLNFNGDTTENEMILVEYNNSTYSVLFDENNVRLQQKPLFFTYDGVPIYNKDQIVYAVSAKKFSIGYHYHTLPLTDVEGDDYVFSSVEARDKWVEEQNKKIILGSNNVEFEFGDTLYFIDDHFNVYDKMVTQFTFNKLEIKFKNKTVYNNYEEAIKGSYILFGIMYRDLVDKFDDEFFKFQYHIAPRDYPKYIKYKDLKKDFLLKYLAGYFNSDKYKEDNYYIIMNDYKVHPIEDSAINDVVFYDEDDARLAARIMKTYLQ